MFGVTGCGDGKNTRLATAAILWMGLGMAVGTLIYLRIPLAARQIPPINWGYADSWEGFWWLVSGAAYSPNVSPAPPSSILQQLGAMGVTLVRQLTPVGLIVAIIGLRGVGSTAAALRLFALLWITPNRHLHDWLLHRHGCILIYCPRHMDADAVAGGRPHAGGGVGCTARGQASRPRWLRCV